MSKPVAKEVRLVFIMVVIQCYNTLIAWVNILPKNPYLAKQVVLKNLNLLKSKNDDFREHLPNC